MAKTSGPRGELIPLHSFDHKFNAAENPYSSNFPEERLPINGNAPQIANKSGFFITTDTLAPRSSVRRKPLPPNSPYSPLNSPRMILPRLPPSSAIRSNHVSNELPLTSFIEDESIKTVSMGTSTSDAVEQEYLTQTCKPHDPEPKNPPPIRNIKYTYRSLDECEEVILDDRNLSEARSPMRFKFFERLVGSKTGWIIAVIVVLIVVIMIGIFAGIEVDKLMDSKKEGLTY